MAQMVEFELAKVLEDIRQDIKETNRKLDKVLEGQAKQEGDIRTIDVKVENLQKGQDELKTEQKAVRAEVSGLYKWIIGLIAGAGLGLGTLLLRETLYN